MYSTCRIKVSKVLKSMIVSSDKIWQSPETGLLHSRSGSKLVLVTFHPVSKEKEIYITVIFYSPPEKCTYCGGGINDTTKQKGGQ